MVIEGGTFNMSGGSINSNVLIYGGLGGGIYMRGGTFAKTGGIITGFASDPVFGNKAWDGSGHAVLAFKGNVTKRMEKTSDESNDLGFIASGTNGTFSGIWEY